MINTLQKPIVTAINAVEPIIQKVNERVRNIIAESCFFIIAAAFFFSRISEKIPELPDLDMGTKNKIVIISFFISMVFSIKGRAEALKLRWPMVAAWGLFCTSATVSFIIHYKDFGYMTLGLVWVLFPLACFIWANRGDYENLFKMICRPLAGVHLCHCLFILYLILFDPNRYKIYEFGYRLRGTTMHPNYFSMLTAAGFICCAYMLLTSKKNICRIIYGVGIVSSGVYLMLASSRTPLLALAAATVMVIIYAAFKKNRVFVLKSAALLVVFLISVGVGVAASAAVVESKSAQMNSEVTVESNTAAKDESNKTEQQAESSSSNAQDEQIKNYLANAGERFNPFGKSLNKLTSGRISVWTAFSRHLNLTGEHWGQREVTIKKEIKADLGFETVHAHNQYLQTAHKMGVFTGIFELAVSVLAIVFLIAAFFKKGKLQPYMTFSIIAVFAFCLISLMEIMGEPFSREMSFLYLSALIPMFFEKQGKLPKQEDNSK